MRSIEEDVVERFLYDNVFICLFTSICLFVYRYRKLLLFVGYTIIVLAVKFLSFNIYFIFYFFFL